MKRVTCKMYYKLYDVIHHKININIHKSVEACGSKYVPMINIIIQLKTLTNF